MEDTERGIFTVQEEIPVRAGTVDLLYPKWIPGHHRPYGSVEAVGDLHVIASGQELRWTRSSNDVYRFRVNVPTGVDVLHVSFVYLSTPWRSSHAHVGPGVALTPEMGRADWESLILYPDGVEASRQFIEATLTYPALWQTFSALEAATSRSGRVRYRQTDLATLVDSPVYAGVHVNRVMLSKVGDPPVTLNLLGDDAASLQIPMDERNRDEAMVREAHALFGPSPFSHYDFMVPLSKRLPPVGVEHLQTSEDGWQPRYFSDRAYSILTRDRLTHEFVHAWNGKAFRPEGMTDQDFQAASDNALLWVYEGATEYWGSVLAARAQMWTLDEAHDLIALRAAQYDSTTGRRWRTLQDTTNDPVLMMHGSHVWPGLQRELDYYNNGLLLWLGIDAQIRTLTSNQRSLDNFAKVFFAQDRRQATLKTYTAGDVINALNRVVPFDWTSWLDSRLRSLGNAPSLLEDLSKSGYRLVYRTVPSSLDAADQKNRDVTDLTFSAGLSVKTDGTIDDVVWGSAAFEAGLVPGSTLTQIDGQPFSGDRLRDAVTGAASSTAPVVLSIGGPADVRRVDLPYHGGLRYPHLERTDGPNLLDIMLSPRTTTP
jgi:predicted metalloprotease with PDZ domain